mgnify:CR=1 FL=1
MNRNFNITLAGLTMIGFLVASCGEKMLQEKTINAKNIQITGESSDYIKVVDGEYTLKVVEDNIIFPVKFELTKKCKGKGKQEIGNLSLNPLDKSGYVIPDIGTDFSPETLSDWDKIKDLLRGEVGKTTTINFKWNYFSREDMQARIMKDIENFEITRADFTESSSDESTSSYSDNDSNSNQEWDEVLDNYEKYVDEYISFLKKANSGDASAMEKYPSLMEKAQEFEESLTQAQDDNSLTATQIKRMAKIQNKMLNAIN